MSSSPVNLPRRRLLGAAAATLLLSVSRAGFAAASQVIAVRIWPSGSYTRVTLESNSALSFQQFSMRNPDRLVIDLQGLQLNSVLRDLNSQISPNDPLIRTVRTGQFTPDTVRVVLELKETCKPQLFTLAPVADYQHRLVADLYPANSKNDPLLSLLDDYNSGKLDNNAPAKPRDKPAGKRTITIMLDPGHGGEDPGAIGPNGTREKDIVLKIAKRLQGMINAEPGMRALLTRDEDVFIPLGVRVAKARKANADLFISLHADAFINPNARGSSVFALSEKGATSSAARYLEKSQNDADLIGGVSLNVKDEHLKRVLLDLTQTATINDGLKLGKAVLGRLEAHNPLHKRQVEQAGFAVLKAPDIPSILVEAAFISNPEEEQKLLSSEFQGNVAQAILGGVKSYFAQGAALARV